MNSTLSSPKAHKCECECPGWCERHGITKNEAWWKLCQSHPGYWRLWEEGRGPGHQLDAPKLDKPPIAPKEGPGTELKRLLKLFGLGEYKGCKCSAHERKMNEWGAAGCRENLKQITHWLQQEANRRQIPFNAWGAQVLIRMAIRMWERKERINGNQD